MPAMCAALIYIVAVLAANLTATLFVPFPVFGQVAIGTLIFGLTFTQRDRMHARGRRFVYAVIALSAVLNLILLVSCRYLWGLAWVDWLHAQGWNWLAEGFAILQSSGPRIFIASLVAIVLAESADTEVYHRLRHQSWLLRVGKSNAVSIPLDSVLFNLIAFAGIFPLGMWVSVVFGEIVVKFTVGALYGWFLRPRIDPPCPQQLISKA